MKKIDSKSNNIEKNKFNFCTLTDEEFDFFSLSHVQSNFFQSSLMKEVLIKQGREVHLLGVKDKKDNILAATLLTSSDSFLGFKTYEALKGVLIDYNDFELLNYFINNLKLFVKEHQGFRLIIDPSIVFVQRDSDANIVDDGIDNRSVVDNLEKLKFKKLKKYSQVKWTYVLDVENKTSEELLKSFKSMTKNHINKTINKYKLIIEELSYDQLAEFKEITASTSERRGFSDRSLKYYQTMYEIFKDKVKFLVVKLDCDLYIENLNNDKSLLEDKLNRMSDSEKNISKKETINNDISGINEKIKEIEQLKEEKGNTITLSCAMFMLYGSEITYLFGGSYDEYMKFCGQYRLQWEMIKYACENGFKRHNFYGINDVFDEKEDQGVYTFKKGFNGYVEELFGAYEVGVHPIQKLYVILKNIKNTFVK